jgi:hypothetical protein
MGALISQNQLGLAGIDTSASDYKASLQEQNYQVNTQEGVAFIAQTVETHSQGGRAQRITHTTAALYRADGSAEFRESTSVEGIRR